VINYLFLGGWCALDRKWKTAQGFVNKAPIFITCQAELDFGTTEDNTAMDNRMNKYFFKPLAVVDRHAAKWIKEHPMHCIVWASKQCEQPAYQDLDGNYTALYNPAKEYI